jgi:hypothetical protein
VQSNPTITSAGPSSILVNKPVSVTFNVNGLQAGAGLTSGTSTVTITNPVVNVGAGTVTATITGSTTGAKTFTVTNPDGGLASATLTVNPVPVISSFNGTGWTTSTNYTTVTLTGSGFQSGFTVSVVATKSGTPTTLAATSLVFTNSGSASFQLRRNTLAPGTYSMAVTLTNPDTGVSNTLPQSWTVT